ncbi:CCR4-NOT transcription complex subunit 7 [Gopherus evgoodei]|uniref:CCR4-NOT transcription complex subunit 7 n=1 Tax=Gopherus evgoodei TaxID=1825980 RepID=UPI0011CF1407|nr:CCR4-NOT transcription complex subunit 7 [Gopherus evgoodei]
MYAQDSIELLTTSGIQFKKHEEEGIETQYFAELLMTSGVVLCEGVKWLSFHSGYDFGYLIKILTNSNLPEEELDFFEILRLFFPVIYDVKYLMKSCKNLKGGLQEVAEQLELERIGPQHQAGSDSLLTGMAFFKMREMFFEDHIDDAKYCGHLYGLGSGSSYVQNGTGNAYEEEATNSHDMKWEVIFSELCMLVYRFYLWLNPLTIRLFPLPTPLLRILYFLPFYVLNLTVPITDLILIC